MINALQKLLSIESVAQGRQGIFPYGEGPAKALEYVLSLCREMGFKTKNADGVYGFAEIGQGKELIGILCHLDVVPAGNGWQYPPFAGTIVGDRLYGRGTIDDKGPAMACIFAMKDILDSGITLNKRIRIIFGQTEENGQWDDIEAYKENEELPTYGFTPDGDFPAIYIEKGIALVKMSMDIGKSGFTLLDGGSAPNMVPDVCKAKVTDINGKEHQLETHGIASHGCAPWLGKNAIFEMMKLITSKDKFHVNLANIYMDLIGDSLHGERMLCCLSDEESGELSMNVGMAKVEDKKISLYLDIRYPVTYKAGDVMERIEARAAAANMEVSLIHQMNPVFMPKDGSIMKVLLNAYRSVTGDTSEPLIIGGGTYARSMDNIIAFGPNIPGHENTEHNKNEYALIEDLNTIREIYKIALQELLKK